MTDRFALRVEGLNVHYGDFQAIWNVSIELLEGRLVSIIGANGSGKSTLLNTITGLLTPSSGSIEFFGKKINGLAAFETMPLGISLVPEGRRVFPRLTVYENLFIGSYPPRVRSRRDKVMGEVYELFPVLEGRHDQMANTLSGGEQQMLAIGRALMSEPKLMLFDEVSLGLAPLVIKDIYRRLEQINVKGITILLVEQDVKRSLKAASFAYILLEGKVVLQGKASSLNEEQVKKAYFGI